MADDLGARIARGTLAQQGSQAVAFATAIAMTTALGRELSLAAFGVYGLVISFTTYLYFALGSAETAAVRAIAAAEQGADRDRAFSTAIVVYTALGLVAGVLIAGGGAVMLGLLDFKGELLRQARIGAVAVGATTAVGWPLKIFQDLLRAEQRFVTASVTEATGAVVIMATTLVLVFGGAPLWPLIAVGGSLPLFVGGTAALYSLARRLAPRPRPGTIRRDELGVFTRVATGMLFVAASDVVITSLDRVVLAAFRPNAVLGLFEGAIRPNNLARALNGAFGVTLLPVASRLSAGADSVRERALLLRGTRYMLVGIVPPVTAMMVMASLVLVAWLGPRYGASANACAIFLAWWLLAPNIAVASTLMVVDARVRRYAVLSWATAAVNLALSLALVSPLGLEGVALGTTLAYTATLPFYLHFALARVGAGLSALARAAWVPGYGTGAVVALLGALAHAVLPLDSAPVAFASLALLTLAGWLFAGLVFLDRDERATVLGLVPRRR